LILLHQDARTLDLIWGEVYQLQSLPLHHLPQSTLRRPPAGISQQIDRFTECGPRRQEGTGQSSNDLSTGLVIWLACINERNQWPRISQERRFAPPSFLRRSTSTYRRDV
jgi:hypothetical protein